MECFSKSLSLHFMHSYTQEHEWINTLYTCMSAGIVIAKFSVSLLVGSLCSTSLEFVVFHVGYKCVCPYQVAMSTSQVPTITCGSNDNPMKVIVSAQTISLCVELKTKTLYWCLLLPTASSYISAKASAITSCEAEVS